MKKCILFLTLALIFLLLEPFNIVTLSYFLLGSFQCLMLVLSYIRLEPISRVDPIQLLLYPFSATLSLGVLVNSMQLVFSKKGIVWRGTHYSADDMASTSCRKDN